MNVVEKYSYNEFDIYGIEDKRALTTKEISIKVNFDKMEITGDCIAYGEWYDLDSEECKELLTMIPKEERLRNFEDLL